MPSNEARSWRIAEYVVTLAICIVGVIITASVMLGDVKANVASNKARMDARFESYRAMHEDIRDRLIRIETHLLGEPK